MARRRLPGSEQADGPPRASIKLAEERKTNRVVISLAYLLDTILM